MSNKRAVSEFHKSTQKNHRNEIRTEKCDREKRPRGTKTTSEQTRARTREHAHITKHTAHI